MPTNANVFNSRVTSEALEKKFRDTFPAQGGAELIQDLFASGVIVPTVDFTAAAQGSELQPNLQTAWDFSTGTAVSSGAGTVTAITNTGFWLVNAIAETDFASGNPNTGQIEIYDGSSAKAIWRAQDTLGGYAEAFQLQTTLTVFLRAGDSLRISNTAGVAFFLAYRQIADVNGNLVNPLGFTFS